MSTQAPPKTIQKDVRVSLKLPQKQKWKKKQTGKKLRGKEKRALIEQLTVQMKEAAKLLEFEHAAYLRDKIKKLEEEQ